MKQMWSICCSKKAGHDKEWSVHPSLLTDSKEKVNAEIPENRQFTTYELHKHFFGRQESWGLTKREKMCRTGWKACYSGILSVHYIPVLILNSTLYSTSKMTSCSGNSTGFTLIGIPEVSLFLNGPIILSDMAYLNPYIFITLTQDGIESVIRIISSTWNIFITARIMQSDMHIRNLEQILSKNDLPLPQTKYFPFLYTKFVPSKTTEICDW